MLWMLLFVPSLAAMWLAIVFIMSRLSAWATLARAYPAGDVLTPNVRYGWQSVRMNGIARYNGAVTVIADVQAVHWSMTPLLRPGHKSFSVPWRDIRAEVQHFVLLDRIVLRFAQASDVTMMISMTLAARLADASQGRFVLPGGARA